MNKETSQMIKRKNRLAVLINLFVLLLSNSMYAHPSNSTSSYSLAEELEIDRLQKEAKERQIKMLKARDQIKKQNCVQAKSRLEQLTTSGRIRLKTDNSTRILSEEEKQGEINATKSAIKEFCMN